jgi:sugar lactone lactonase YvrE
VNVSTTARIRAVGSAVCLALVAWTGVTWLAEPAGAAPVALPVRQVGGSGHAGLYGWGMATMGDGSVLIGDYWNFRIFHYATDGTNLGLVVDTNTKGAGATQHQSPYGIAVDPVTQDVYFGDVDQNKTVDKYAADGTYLLSWGGNGTGPGRFMYPSRVAVGPDRRVYVADQWDHNVVVHDPDGTELFAFGGNGAANGQFKQPRGLAFDAAGRLFVVDNYNQRVQVFDAEGTFLFKFGQKGTAPGQFAQNPDLRGLAIDRTNGWVYVVDASSGYVNKYDTSGNYLLRFGGFGSGPGKFPGGGREVTVDGDGNVWVGDMPGFRAQKFSPAGELLLAVPNPPEPPPPAGFNQPRGVALDAAGNIFVTDTHNWRVQKLAPNGSFLLEWGHRGGGDYGFNYQRGLAVDQRDGTVVVADTDNHKIKKYTNDGVYLWDVGAFGTAPGQFKNPHSLDVGPDGRIYVADTQNQRIQVLSEAGVPILAFGSKGNGNGQFQFPRSVTVDADGTMWVSDSIRGVVQHFAPDGAYLGQFGSKGTADNQLARAADVEVDATQVVVADVDTHKVKVWTKDGQFLFAFGGGGSELGKMFNPHGLDLTPGGRLYVVEQTGERVQEFALTDVIDGAPPDASVAVPSPNQQFAQNTAIAMAGSAVDDVAVASVKVAIRNQDTGLWWRPNGTWGAFAQHDAVLGAPGSPVTAWTFAWPGGPVGRYALQVITQDGTGKTDPTKPWVPFRTVT